MNDATKPKYLGDSRDGRTNRWRVTCPTCRHEFEPLTTRLATQSLICEKCEALLQANYNIGIVRLMRV